MRRFAVGILATLFLLAAGPAFAESDATTVFRVSGMTCGMCAKAIERALGDVPGVQSVEIDRDSGRVEVVAASTLDAGTLEAAIEAAGSYEAELEPEKG